MRLPAVLLLVFVTALAGLAASGCAAVEPAGGEPEADVALASSEDAGAEAAPRRAKRTWTGGQAVRYERSYRICSVFTVQEVATELGVRKRPKAAARAHADTWYDPRWRRAAYHGCLDAFHRRPPALG